MIAVTDETGLVDVVRRSLSRVGVVAVTGGRGAGRSTRLRRLADALPSTWTQRYVDGRSVDDGLSLDLGRSQELADDIAEDLEEQQAASAGGSATVTIGGETWEFDSILCAFGEEEIGQEGAELVASATADGLQFYVSVDSFGESIGLNDIEDFENPSVAWDASEFGGAEVTIEADGKDVTGSSDTFTSEVTGTEASGSFEATCP